MTVQEIHKPKTIGISISESPDMPVLGLGDGHLRDAMSEVATHLLASGDDLAYGGDLRTDGFTRMLFELVLRYTRQPKVFVSYRREDQAEVNHMARVFNYFAWPVHIRMTNDALDSMAEEVGEVAVPKLLDMEGESMTIEHRKSLPMREPDDETWTIGLTAMRQTMQGQIDARILLGGRVEGYKGRMPGVAEEALLSLQASQAVFLLGGFGGCTHDIAETLGLADTWAGSREHWPERWEFENYGPESLRNGLTLEENKVLARTPYIEQSLPLVLRGLRRLRDIETREHPDRV